jgi:hypothetical protein
MNIPSGSFPRHDRRSLGAEASEQLQGADGRLVERLADRMQQNYKIISHFTGGSPGGPRLRNLLRAQPVTFSR